MWPTGCEIRNSFLNIRYVRPYEIYLHFVEFMENVINETIVGKWVDIEKLRCTV